MAWGSRSKLHQLLTLDITCCSLRIAQSQIKHLNKALQKLSHNGSLQVYLWYVDALHQVEIDKVLPWCYCGYKVSERGMHKIWFWVLMYWGRAQSTSHVTRSTWIGCRCLLEITNPFPRRPRQKGLTSIVVYHALNGPPDTVIPCEIQRSLQTANLPSAIHHERVSDRRMFTLGCPYQRILGLMVFELTSICPWQSRTRTISKPVSSVTV